MIVHDALGRQGQVLVQDLHHLGSGQHLTHGGKPSDIYEKHCNVRQLAAQIHRIGAFL